MAIEIRELIIKASIDNRLSMPQATQQPIEANGQDELIKRCVEQSVEQVLRELARRKER